VLVSAPGSLPLEELLLVVGVWGARAELVSGRGTNMSGDI